MTARSARWARRLGSVAAVTAAVVTAAGPVAADVGAGGARFTACAPNQFGHCIRGEMVARVYPTLVGVVVVDFTCVIVGYPDAVSTQIDVCSFNGVAALGVPTTSPTGVIAQQGTAIVRNGGSYVACIGGAGHFAESIIGPVTVTGGACETVPVTPTP